MSSRFGVLGLILTAPYRSRERLQKFRDERVRSMVRHAYDSVPFYREWFDRHGVKPRDVAGVGDLAVIPPVSKTDMIDHPREFLTAAGTDPAQLIERRTSGSSGAIFTSWHSRSEEWLAESLRLRIKAYHGLRPSDRQMRIVVGPPVLPLLQRVELVMRRLERLHRVNPTEPPDELRRQFLAFGPDVLTGMAGAVSGLAESLAVDGPPWFRRPRLVITGAEVLTPSMRQRISSVFGAPVYERYACNELDQLAYQCRDGNELHTCDESVVIEVLRNGTPAKAGERGEVVATSLNFRTMPFIRYRLGDVVTRGADRCACGAPFGTIRAIEGRMNDYFRLPGGRMLHPYRLAAGTTGRVRWVREFQVTQETPNLIVARIVANAMPSREELAPLQSMVAGVLGPDVELRIELVPAIDWGKSGKHRFFRSRVASNYDDIDWEGM